MKSVWRWSGVALGTLCVLAGCSRDPRVDELLQQLRDMQAAPAAPAEPEPLNARTEALRGEVRDAFAPLREGLSGLTRDQAEVRSRLADVSGEMGEVLEVVKESVDEAARTRLQDLQKRLLALENEMRQRAEAAQAEQALILRALELTADKLDAFLRRVQQLGQPGAPAGTAEPQSGPPPAKTGDDAQTSSDLSWWWGTGALLMALGGAWLLARWRHFPAQPVIGSQAAEESPIDVRIAPEPERLRGTNLRAVGRDDDTVPLRRRSAEPAELSVEIEHPCPSSVVGIAERWLLADPRVLVLPEPHVRATEDRLWLRYRLVPHLPTGEIARVEADVIGALAGRGGRGVAEATDRKVLAARAFRQGNA